MIIVALSDTHGKHHSIDIPEGDIIIHCGDITRRSNFSDVMDYILWFSALNFQYKILIAGNHDRFIERKKQDFLKILYNRKISYLENQVIQIQKHIIFGSPFTLNYGGIGSFTYNDISEAKRYWELIPGDTDILVTHGPPQGFRDFSLTGNRHAGCPLLLEKVLIIKPQYHFFGHIHEAYGTESNGNTVFVNASIVNGSEDPVNKPVIIDLKT